jgi:hypothetical protein
MKNNIRKNNIVIIYEDDFKILETNYPYTRGKIENVIFNTLRVRDRKGKPYKYDLKWLIINNKINSELEEELCNILQNIQYNRNTISDKLLKVIYLNPVLKYKYAKTQMQWQ